MHLIESRQAASCSRVKLLFRDLAGVIIGISGLKLGWPWKRSELVRLDRHVFLLFIETLLGRQVRAYGWYEQTSLSILDSRSGMGSSEIQRCCAKVVLPIGAPICPRGRETILGTRRAAGRRGGGTFARRGAKMIRIASTKGRFPCLNAFEELF